MLLRWPSCIVERGGRDHDRNMTWRKSVPVDETAVGGARRPERGPVGDKLGSLRDVVDLHREEQRCIFLLELDVGVAVLGLPGQGTVRDHGLLAGALAVLAENAGSYKTMAGSPMPVLCSPTSEGVVVYAITAGSSVLSPCSPTKTMACSPVPSPCACSPVPSPPPLSLIATDSASPSAAATRSSTSRQLAPCWYCSVIEIATKRCRMHEVTDDALCLSEGKKLEPKWLRNWTD